MFSGVGKSYICSQCFNCWTESSESKSLCLDSPAVPLGEISKPHISQLACPEESQGFLN